MASRTGHAGEERRVTAPTESTIARTESRIGTNVKANDKPVATKYAVYYGDNAVATSEEYAQQAQTLATSATEPAADSEWLPLGVFAMTQDGEASGPPPPIFLQLTVSKEGVIAGTVTNTETDKTQAIEGMVDKKTQRSAWVVQGKESPIMETGIANLTKDEVPALLHFADGQTQQWLSVRLEEPEGGFMAVVEVCGMNPWLIEMLQEYGCREIVITQPDHRPKKKTDRRDTGFLSNLLWINRQRLAGGQRAPGMRRIKPPTSSEAENRQLTTIRCRGVGLVSCFLKGEQFMSTT